MYIYMLDIIYAYSAFPIGGSEPCDFCPTLEAQIHLGSSKKGAPGN